MRRLLYSLVFVSVLLLAGSAVLADPAKPSGHGPAPAGEHQVWLPVVGVEQDIEALYPGCPFRAEPIWPEEGATIRSNSDWLVFTAFAPDTGGLQVPLSVLTVYLYPFADSSHPIRLGSSLPGTGGKEVEIPGFLELIPYGEHQWTVLIECYGGRGWLPGAYSFSRRLIREP